MSEMKQAAAAMQQVIDAMGGAANLAALLGSTPNVAEAMDLAGGPHAVAEAMLAVAEGIDPANAIEVAEAVEAAGGPFAIAHALNAASSEPTVAEAVAAAGGTLMIAEALSTSGGILRDEALRAT